MLGPNRLALAAALLPLAAGTCLAAVLDLSASYKAKAQAYINLNLDESSPFNHSFISQDARLGVSARRIYLETWKGEEMLLDVNIGLRAIGVAGSTTPHQAPFNKAADRYPGTSFIPFLERANLDLQNAFGYPVQATFGRQNFRLASGLLLDDDGAGLTGAVLRGGLPWWGMKAEAFYFSARNSQAAPNNLNLFGGSLLLPLEGTWQFSQLFEDDRLNQPAFGCSFPGMTPLDCRISRALRLFSSIRYQLQYGPIVFDGEVAMQRGIGKISSAVPGAPQHVSYDGNAQVLKAKWKQRLYRTGEGIARLSVARGSGDDLGTGQVDEAFFPSLGHRFDGLERSGFGEFFGASTYDAYGGNYSSATASGLRHGSSGIVTVGAGYTFPAYRGFALDIDYFLYQAERIRSGKRTLGNEWDFKLRYNVRDTFTMSLIAALFGVGSASNPLLGRSRKYAFELSGRF